VVPRLAAVLAVGACALLLAGSAQPSRPVAGDAHVVSLVVNARGEALLTYRGDRVVRHVLAWGTNDLRLDYSGGWSRYHRQYWRTFAGTCARYRGPRLAAAIASCTAPDGSYWAVQGVPGRSFEISHWTGALARVQTGMAWAYDGRFQVLYGRVTYLDRPSGGRTLRLDGFHGIWLHEKPFSTHAVTGAFCYGLFPPADGPASRYRLSVSGPAGTPLLVSAMPKFHNFHAGKTADVDRQQRAAARLRAWGVSNLDADCGPVLRMAAKLKGH